MGCKIDLTGQRFGRLTAISECAERKNGGVVWECKCDCGNIVKVRANHLRKGAIVSCGCYNTDIIKKHGRARTSLYHVWQCMKDRCENSNHPQYKDYGGRGICIRDEWHDPETFIKWAIENGYKEETHGKCTLDRIDVNGNYEPENCRWVDMKAQCRNRRNNVVLEHNGESHCLAEWAELLGIPYSRVLSRWRRGWPTRDILFGRP